VYDYFVNEAFNAGYPFTNDPKSNLRPRARRNDYGFTVGGPIQRDKMFSSASFEQFRETRSTNTQYQIVPTAAYRNGDFRAAITPTSKVIGIDPLGADAGRHDLRSSHDTESTGWPRVPGSVSEQHHSEGSF